MNFLPHHLKKRLSGLVAGSFGLLSINTGHAQITFLSSFNGSDGANPETALILSGNTFYGATQKGGADGDGVLYSIPVTGGTPTVLTSFNGTDGNDPMGNLASGGSVFYGTTESGGIGGVGTIYSLPVSGGTPTTLASFGPSGFSGSTPNAGVILSGNTLYGTTSYGGSAVSAFGEGVVYSLPTTGGTPTVLGQFNGTNGSNPNGSLLLVGNTLYGVTYSGGTNSKGTIYSVPIAGGAITTLANFNGTNGANPLNGLILGGNVLYGSTENGGAFGDGTVFSLSISSGILTTLTNFNGINGDGPQEALTLVGNTLYGTTTAGGTYNDGTLFSLSTSGGSPKTLTSFGAGSTGYNPDSDLTLINNTLYGTTSYGGANNDGTIFSYQLSVPEPPTWAMILAGASLAALARVMRSSPRPSIKYIARLT